MNGASLLARLKKKTDEGQEKPVSVSTDVHRFDAWAWDGRYIKGKKVCSGEPLAVCLKAIARAQNKDKCREPLAPEVEGYDGSWTIYDSTDPPAGPYPVGVVQTSRT